MELLAHSNDLYAEIPRAISQSISIKALDSQKSSRRKPCIINVTEINTVVISTRHSFKNNYMQKAHIQNINMEIKIIS